MLSPKHHLKEDGHRIPHLDACAPADFGTFVFMPLYYDLFFVCVSTGYVSLLGKKLPEHRMRPASLEAESGMGIPFKGVIEGLLLGRIYNKGKEAGLGGRRNKQR